MKKNFEEKILLERHNLIKEKVANDNDEDIEKLEQLMFQPIKEYLDIKQKYFEEKNYKIEFQDIGRKDWSDSNNPNEVNALSTYLDFKLKDNSESRLRIVIGYYSRIGIIQHESGYTVFVDDAGTGSLSKPNDITEFTEKYFRPLVEDEKLFNLLFPVFEKMEELYEFLESFFAKYIANEKITS